MKKALLSTVALLSLAAAIFAAQTQGKDSRPVNFPPNPTGSAKKSNDAKPPATEAKTEQQANHPSAPTSKPTETTENTNDASLVKASDSTPLKTEESASAVSPAPVESASLKPASDASIIKPSSDEAKKDSTPPPAKSPETAAAKKSEPAAAAPSTPLAPTSVYRVGVGDVLDIQLLNAPSRESTLFTVLAGGMLEYPPAGEALKVEGLTTDEIGAQLGSQVKIYDNPQVAVSVREYASHNVIITGLVHDPGTKALRREAVPLYVLLAEAQPRADAARAIIMRTGSPSQTIDISDTNATSALIYPNDVIRLVAAPPPAPLFFYIVGQVASPGQKDFHPGMTLTQAIFAAGGATRFAGSKAKVMRQGADGRLTTTEFNLKKIEQGKDPDPQLEAGDRIDITRSGW
ncbi:MAG: polysaccharide biosynthesis/export family protein [Acidobacteria bacterium]|nr:polysaccharide biosynthesis/export family protein [Acidobacteriota bacterium]